MNIFVLRNGFVGILKRAVVPLFLVLMVCAVSVYFYAIEEKNTMVMGKADNQKTVIIDAGHGGFDGGAVAPDGTIEKDINLNISLTLAKFLKQSGFRVIMTRESDVSTEDTESPQIASKKRNDLKNRLKLMGDYPDSVFVSIHLNKFTTSSAFGSQVFYSKGEESALLADFIQKSIINLIQPENTRVNKQATSSTYLLYNATVPAVLVECGFLSNAKELELLKQPDYQKKMAFSVYIGILEYFEEKENGSKF